MTQTYWLSIKSTYRVGRSKRRNRKGIHQKDKGGKKKDWMIKFNDIERMVTICLKEQERIAVATEIRQFWLNRIREVMQQSNIKRFECKNGKLVILTYYAVRIISQESRKKSITPS